jgi:hypothetical protein
VNPDGTINWQKAATMEAEKGNTNALSSLAPFIQHQQDLQGAFGPDQFLNGGGASSGGGSSAPAGGSSSGGSSARSADAIPSDGSAADQLADNLATRIESKGQSDPYDALGPTTKNGDRAYGKYQVMEDNIPAWTKEVLGVEMTPDEFLDDPKAQDEVARAKLGQYIKETGDPQDAASMWFTGKPLAQGANLKDQNGVSGSQYAATATAGMGGGGTQVASNGGSDAPVSYASPDKPAIPPVSAAAGSSIPRGSSSTAAGAVGGASPQSSSGLLAANNPAWAGINASLPVGPSGTPAAAQTPLAPVGPSQGSVASTASTAGIPGSRQHRKGGRRCPWRAAHATADAKSPADRAESRCERIPSNRLAG